MAKGSPMDRERWPPCRYDRRPPCARRNPPDERIRGCSYRLRSSAAALVDQVADPVPRSLPDTRGEPLPTIADSSEAKPSSPLSLGDDAPETFLHEGPDGDLLLGRQFFRGAQD